MIAEHEYCLCLVHLLQVYSNSTSGAAAPQELLFHSTRSERPNESRLLSKRARQLRPHETERLLAHFLEVRNVREVARVFGLSRTTVARMLTEHGVNASRRMTEAQRAIAAELYQQGFSSHATGKRLGFDNHTILKGLRQLGITIRPRTNRP